MPTVKELQAAGCESLRAIAAGLEERGIPARAVASGLRSRWPDCWRLPALSTPQASPSPPSREGQALKLRRIGRAKETAC
jgi:hypothetical protein